MTPLHTVGDAIRQLLLMVPLPVVRGLFVALILAVLLWVLLLIPRAEAVPESGSTRTFDNLKLWASLALAIQLLLYIFV